MNAPTAMRSVTEVHPQRGQATVTIRKGPWWERAACQGENPAMWELDSTEELIQAGERICWEQCPVSKSCLKDAVARRDVGVVRGGERLRGAKAQPWRKTVTHECRGCSTLFRGFQGRRYCTPACFRRHQRALGLQRARERWPASWLPG